MGPFDPRSIVAITGVFSALSALVAFTLYRDLPASNHSIRIWAPGAMVMFVAITMMGQHDKWPEYATVWLASGLLWTGMSLCVSGYCRFAGRPSPKRLLSAIGIAVLLLSADYVWVHRDYSFRVAITAAFILLFAALSFTAAADMRPRSLPVRLMMLAYATLMVLCAVRLLIVVSGLDPTSRLLDPNPMQATFLIGYGVLELLGNVAFLLAVSAREHDALRHAAAYDPLSGALNRGAIMTQLQREFKRAERGKHALSVLLIDIDHFKQVNDSFGHAAGDRAITDFARRAMAQLRAGDVFGRFGGEEFLVILPETGIPAAAQAAERVRGSAAAGSGDGPTYTVSVGVAALAPNMTLDALLEAADNALYLAKEKGRNRVEIFSQQSGVKTPETRVIAN